MTENEIREYVIQNVDFPEGYASDFELNDEMLDGNYCITIPNAFPGGVSVINAEGKLVSFPQREWLNSGVTGVIIDFSSYLEESSSSGDDYEESSSSGDDFFDEESSSSGIMKSINGWKIRYNRGPVGEGADYLDAEEMLKYMMVF